MTSISTLKSEEVFPYLKNIQQPGALSHKGQNGKVLVIGGSSLFHSAVLWAAEAASHIVDMVHVASTEENNEVIQKIKVLWQGGMVVSQKDIEHYATEDAVVLVGNGMMRVGEEGDYTRSIVKKLITQYPEKQFVFDAGALQMMDKEWLLLLQKKAIITPHQKEFQALFGDDLHELSIEEKEKVVMKKAKEYKCIILLKAVEDIVSDGGQVVRVSGGNAGLTKGGTGDILAGIVAGMSANSDPLASAVVGSYLLKQTADTLATTKGLWYSTQDVLSTFPSQFLSLTKTAQSLT